MRQDAVAVAQAAVLYLETHRGYQRSVFNLDGFLRELGSMPNGPGGIVGHDASWKHRP